MRRSEAAVSVGVKPVIAALCRLLTATGLHSVPTPEAFRRAKFSGGPEVEDQFWKLLGDILHTTTIVSSEADPQPTGASDCRKLVSTGLWQTGYQADWLYGREGGGRVSSRDLLLALGWLLATGTLERLLTHQAQRLDTTLLTSTLVNPQVVHKAVLDPASLRRLQWLIGCLRFQRRSLLSMQEERARLLHAVLSASLSSSSSSSSSNKSSSVLREDSVVDCHHTGPVVLTPGRAANGSRGVCRHGNRGLEKLDDMLLKLPTAQRGQKRGEEDGKVGEEDGERLEGGTETSSLALPSLLPSFPQTYRARLQGTRPDRRIGLPADGPRVVVGPPGDLQASQASRLLLQTEARLREGRERHRLANKTQLQEVIGRLDELVLIPP
ncbi:uncharacterized protein tedc1 [Diretmus argenteus]